MSFEPKTQLPKKPKFPRGKTRFYNMAEYRLHVPEKKKLKKSHLLLVTVAVTALIAAVPSQTTIKVNLDSATHKQEPSLQNPHQFSAVSQSSLPQTEKTSEPSEINDGSKGLEDVAVETSPESFITEEEFEDRSPASE